jgi:tetratricopeptide (TPR) repeat protein
MQLPARAVDALIEGLDVTNSEPKIVLALARQLREVGRLDEALQHLKQAVAVDPLNVDAWRELAILFERGGRRDDGNRALAAVAVLGSPVERKLDALWRPASALENSLASNVIATFAVDNAYTVPAANMLQAIGDVVGKLYPASLEQYGITARDRLTAKAPTPLFELASRIGRAFAAEIEIYEHPSPQPIVIVEPFETPAVVISQSVRRLPLAQQAFVLAYAIAPIAARLHPALWLRTPELEVSLAGATRVVVPNYSLGHADETELANAREVFRKFVGRKWRRQLELSCEEMVAKPPQDLAAWQVALRQTCLRAALLVADDLGASIEAARHVVDLPDARNAALVQGSDVVRDLVRFWISNRAAGVRQHANLSQP